MTGTTDNAADKKEQQTSPTADPVTEKLKIAAEQMRTELAADGDATADKLAALKKRKADALDALKVENEKMRTELAADAEPTADAPQTKKVGRPRKNDGRKRTSVVVAPQLWQDFKILAIKLDLTVSDFLDMALDDALRKYKK